MALFFGIFQGFMPLIGWLIGNSVQLLIISFDHWVAFGILFFIGIKLILQSFKTPETKKNPDILKTTILLSLALATSIDALITGVSFGFVQVKILEASGIIALTTFLATVLGAKLGEKTSFLPARWAERLGGLVLIGIGLKILLEHLTVI